MHKVELLVLLEFIWVRVLCLLNGCTYPYYKNPVP